VVPLPSLTERRRREIMLERGECSLPIDLVLAGEPLGLETTRDLFREVRHALPGACGRVRHSVSGTVWAERVSRMSTQA
jgi:hypothetical protein